MLINSSFLDKLEKKSIYLFSAILILFAFVLIAYLPIYGKFSSDTYGYYLLGEGIFKEGSYSDNVVIDYYSFHEFPQPSRRFPPLYPFLVGAVDHLTGLKIYCGVFINLLIVLVSFFSVASLCKKLGVRIFFGISLFCLFCITDFDFAGEVIGGKSIPLSLLLFFIQINLIFSTQLKKFLSIVYIAIFSFLLFFNRYDTLFYVFFIPIAIFIFNAGDWKANILKMSLYYTVFLFFFLPWGIRNLELYGEFITSDNKMSAISTYGNGTQICYWAKGLPATVFEDFSTWFTQRVSYFGGNLMRLFLFKSLFFIPVILFVRKGTGSFSKNQFIFFIIYVLYTLFTLCAISLTPFKDTRYFSISYLWSILLLLIVFEKNVLTLKQYFWRIALVLTINILLFAAYFIYSYKQHFSNKSENLNEKILAFVETKKYDPKKVLVGHLFAEELNYYTGLKAIYLPRNRENYLYNEDYEAWIKDWKVDIVVVENKFCNLFSIKYIYEPLDENYSIVRTGIKRE